MAAAKAEERRLLVELAQRGELGREPEPPPSEPTVHTFEDILRHLRRVHIPTLKASTRRNYEQRLMLYIEPFFRDRALSDLESTIPEFAAMLAADGLAPSTRRGVLITLRSAVGTFYEGAIATGYPSDATEDALQANIVAAKYSK